jgi:hypothetical protein
MTKHVAPEAFGDKWGLALDAAIRQGGPKLWQQHKKRWAEAGVIFPEVQGYATDALKRDYRPALDALPTLSTSPNGAIPTILTTYLDIEPVRIVFAPTKAAQIYGERKMGTWLDDTAMFNVIESTGETAAYGDYVENGRSGINQNFPQRQSFHFQVIEEYGERQLERADLTKISYVAEVNRATAENLKRYLNFMYFFGEQGLQNYGGINDPTLGASLTPGTKAAGNGNVWITSSGQPNGTANEIFDDIQAMFWNLTTNTGGLIDSDSKMKMCMSPGTKVAMTITNSFDVSVGELVKEHFPNMEIETAVQFGVQTTANNQGIAAGNLVQLFGTELDGVESVFCSFTEKMRAHKMEVRTSSFKRKMTSGGWGTVWRYPIAEVSMIGV